MDVKAAKVYKETEVQALDVDSILPSMSDFQNQMSSSTEMTLDTEQTSMGLDEKAGEMKLAIFIIFSVLVSYTHVMLLECCFKDKPV